MLQNILSSPATGDLAPVVFGVLGVAAVAIIVVLILSRKKGDDDEDEE